MTSNDISLFDLDSSIRVFDKRTEWSTATVIGVQSEKDRGENRALRGAGGSRTTGREHRLKADRLRTVKKKTTNPFVYYR